MQPEQHFRKPEARALDRNARLAGKRHLKPAAKAEKPDPATKPAPLEKPKKVEEIGGPPGPEPTRYGDWQFNGKVTDF